MRLALVLVFAACGDTAHGPVATFDIATSGPIAWGSAPFPSDVFLGDDGAVALASLPSTAPVWESIRTMLDQHHGFCGTCPVHFPIAGAIDPATLAAGAVMIDPTGAKVPIDVEWDPTASVIAVRPRRGIVPTPGSQYIAALTDAIHDTDGNALRADAGLRSTRAATVTGPALAALAGAGVANVVSVAAYTVEDPAVVARDLAARVTAYYTAHGAPTITVDQVWRTSDGTLDALMGVPATDRPGLDVPAMTGTAGTLGVAHGSIALVIKGTFNSVRVITGTGTDLGIPIADTLAGDRVPFVLAIPAGADVTHLPLVVFHHGLGGTLTTSLAAIDLVGQAGSAFLALETFQHGERSTTAVDTSHALRGDGGSLGPDGFFEHTTLTVALRLLALQGTPPDQVGSPAYIFGGLTQMVADFHALLELVHASDLAPIAAADPSLAGLAFDRTRVSFIGVSLGTIVGATTLVADDTVSAAVFNVPPAGIIETILENAIFRSEVETLMLRPLEIPNVTYEPELELSMQPLMGFAQWVLHPVETPALARALLAKPRDLMWQLAGLDETAGVAGGDNLIGALGVPAIGTYTHATVVPGTSPAQHRAAYRFAMADHFMGLLNGAVSAVNPPGVPPFDTRAQPLMYANPIADVQHQTTHFLVTHEIAAP